MKLNTSAIIAGAILGLAGFGFWAIAGLMLVLAIIHVTING
jgi:hypothetical protein